MSPKSVSTFKLFTYSKYQLFGLSAALYRTVSVSYQGDVPVSRTQHLQNHLNLLER